MSGILETTPSPKRERPHGTLETSAFINANNPTLVGLWDLNDPSLFDTESAPIRLPLTGPSEVLGSEGDHRTRASDEKFNPPGQYKAICKLFMGYVNSTDKHIGTGWLLSDDIVVTTGRHLYERRYKSGFLKYIKCYFDYKGKSSAQSYFHGVTAAAPAEYLKCESLVHDVGFIRLNKKVKGIQPLSYSFTPIAATAQLGVVGFPGDLDFGERLYEDWAEVKIDLEKTDTLLSYLIDTSPGQSGAPVLRMLSHGKVDVIGVHVSGGYPNVGSVIGRYGNSFDEYILAMDVKGKTTKSSSVTVHPAKGLVPGFQLFLVHPKSEGTDEPNPTSDLPNRDENAFDDASGLDNLFEKPKWEPTKGKPSREYKPMGSLIGYPEVLRLPEPGQELPALDFDKALENAKDQDDIKTAFYVNFLAPLEGEVLRSQRELMESVKIWQAWTSANCEAKVQQQVDAGRLPSDSKGQVARGTYRAKVFDFLMMQATWVTRSNVQPMNRRIESRISEFHSKIMAVVLEGFSIPPSVYKNLERVLDEITNGIKLQGNHSSETQQYWIMLTKYEYEPISGTVQAVVRTISFQVTHQAREYTTGKARYGSVAFDLNFNEWQVEFVPSIFSKIKEMMNDKQVKQGMQLLEGKVLDVNVPAE